jgi:membrane protease YdiL (CAAX protease family)
LPDSERPATLFDFSVVTLRDGVIFAYAVATLFAVVSLRRYWGARRGWKSMRAQSRQSIASAVLGQWLLTCVPAAYYFAGGWTLESVGVTRAPPLLALGFGALAYLFFYYLVAAVLPGFHRDPRAEARATLQATLALLPRARMPRIGVLAVLCVFNPVTEELVFRGLLVHQATHIGLPLWLAVLAGAVVNAVNHAYQSRRAILQHLAFYGVAVALLYSPAGLLGAIGLHLVGDAYPFLRLRESLRAYRHLRRHSRRRP